MIDLHRLAGFHLVATAGGYARAVRLAPYPITQPALHQQVRKLEREVGVPLLERLGKDRMQPTPAGAALLAFAAPFFRDLPAVVRSLRDGAFDGALSIQAESLLIRQLLPGWLRTLRQRRPGARIHLQELPQGDVAPLRSGAADVVIAHLPTVPGDIAAETVAELHPCLVVPRASPRQTAPRLRDLAMADDLPFLAYPAGSRQHALQLQALTLHDALPRQVMHLDTADLILGFTAAGLGWSLVPSLDPAGPAGRRVASFPLQRPRTTFPVQFAWRKDAPAHPLLDALLQIAVPPRRRPVAASPKAPVTAR